MFGILTVFADFPTMVTRLVVVTGASGGFIVAGLALRAPAGTLRFAPWQIGLAAIAACVLLSGLVWEQRNLVGVVQRMVIFAGGAGAALWLSQLGASGVRLVLGCLAGAMVAYIAFYAALHGVMLQKSGGVWTTSFYPFVNIRQFTNTLAPVTLAAILMWTSRSVIWGLVALVLCTTIFWSGGRGPVLAILFGCAVAVWLSPPASRAALRLRIGAVLAAASVLSLLLPRVHPSFGFWQRLVGMRHAETLEEASSLRAGLWSQTLDLIAQRPWFGHGFNTWLSQNPEFANHGSPHNFALEVLHDFGIVGGCAILCLVFVTAFLRLRRAKGVGGTHLVVVSMLWAMLAQSGVDSIFWSYTSLYLVVLCFAMAYATRPEAAPPPATA